MFRFFIDKIVPSALVMQEKDTNLEAKSSGALPFSDILTSAIDNMQETAKVSQEDSYKLAMGDIDDLHTMMINSAKAATAMEFTVEVTTRAVSAYNEILRMQI